ncbi:MAG: adenylate/guanylate cyclase domain-containing protein [Geminicoccaceae bacterium]
MIGDMDGIYSSWSTDAPEGFGDAEVAVLSRAAASVAGGQVGSLARIAGTLVEVYLGRDAGRRVLAGRIARGVADRIATVLWYSDLRGYTRITDNAAPEQIIPLLNDYAEATISSIHEVGGDVLKLIGDGTLRRVPGRGCGRGLPPKALKAAKLAGKRFKALNERRAAAGLPWTRAYLGLHVGEVLYGNIGSPDRLDFTVVGPASRVARIAAMCRSVERDVLSPGFRRRRPARAPRQAGLGRSPTPCAASASRRSCSRFEPDFVPR